MKYSRIMLILVVWLLSVSAFVLNAQNIQSIDTNITPPLPDAITTSAAALKAILLDSVCQLACYNQLEPGVTTRTQLEAFLTTNAIVYRHVLPYGDDVTQSIYYWDMPPESSQLLSNAAGVEVIFADDVVHQIRLPIKVTIPVIERAFGYPDEIFTIDSDAYSLLYYADGIAFQFDTRDETLVVTLGNPDSKYKHNVNDMVGTPVNHPCDVYGTFPCIVPTATPLPPITLPEAG